MEQSRWDACLGSICTMHLHEGVKIDVAAKEVNQGHHVRPLPVVSVVTGVSARDLFEDLPQWDDEMFDENSFSEVIWDIDAEQDDMPSSVIWDEELLHDFESHEVLSEVIWDAVSEMFHKEVVWDTKISDELFNGRPVPEGVASFGEGLDFEQEVLDKLYVEDLVAAQIPTKDSVVRNDASQVGLDELHCDDTVWDEDIQSNKDLHCELLKQLAMGIENKPNGVAVGKKQGSIHENDVLASGQQHLAFSADSSQECNIAQVERMEEEEPPKTDDNCVLDDWQPQPAVTKAYHPKLVSNDPAVHKGFALVKQTTIISPRAYEADAQEVINEIPLLAVLVSGGGQFLLDVKRKVDSDEVLAYEDFLKPTTELGLVTRHLELKKMLGITVGHSVLSLELGAVDKDQVIDELYNIWIKLQPYKQQEGSFTDSIVDNQVDNCLCGIIIWQRFYYLLSPSGNSEGKLYGTTQMGKMEFNLSVHHGERWSLSITVERSFSPWKKRSYVPKGSPGYLVNDH